MNASVYIPSMENHRPPPPNPARSQERMVCPKSADGTEFVQKQWAGARGSSAGGTPKRKGAYRPNATNGAARGVCPEVTRRAARRRHGRDAESPSRSSASRRGEAFCPEAARGNGEGFCPNAAHHPAEMGSAQKPQGEVRGRFVPKPRAERRGSILSESGKTPRPGCRRIEVKRPQPERVPPRTTTPSLDPAWLETRYGLRLPECPAPRRNPPRTDTAEQRAAAPCR
jgi:hypothetical protein